MIGPPPLFFHDGKPRAGPTDGFSEGAGACLKYCVAIWGFSTGRRCGRRKEVDLDAKTAPYLE